MFNSFSAKYLIRMSNISSVFILSLLISKIGLAKNDLITEGTQWSNTLLEFNVTGSKGNDGKDGQSFAGQEASDGSSGFFGSDGSDGSNGRDGGDATRPEKGTDGGVTNLFFDLPEKADVGLITVTGYLAPVEGERKNLNKYRIILDDRGFIRPVSRGGQGGMGGYGGFGENGGDGGRGGDGVGNQRGGDGGDGGNGGDAGAGTNGALAGKGGEVRIGIPVNRLEIAWVLDPYVNGGLGGTSGEHGRPGNGGSGGSGGTGGTYTVTVTKTRTVSDGKGGTTTESYTDTETRQAPNGSSGSPGSSGDEQRSALKDGEDGKDGKIQWYIVDDQGKETLVADNRYQLNLVGFRFIDKNSGHEADGIFEPGEEGVIEQIFVKNTGLLPTPSGAKTRFKVKSGAYLITDNIEFSLPEGLQPGEVRLVQGSDNQELKIPFKVRDLSFKVPGTEPFIRKELIRPIGLADVADIERQIPEFNDHNMGSREFTVQFPVMIEPIQTPPSLARGEAGRFIFKITNISGQDFGSESEIKRQLKYFIKRNGGDLADEDLEFFSTKGKPLSLNKGFLKEIVNLKANKSKIIEFIVGVSGSAESYRTAVSTMDLNIDRLGTQNGEGLQTVQRKVQLLNIADDYFKTPDSDFLLVTNHRMSRDAYVAWKQVAEEKLQTTIDIWDLSYKNFIRFMQKLTEDNALETQTDGYSEHRTSLAEDFAGKTIIILANEFGDTSGQNQGHSLNVWDYIKIQDLRRAAVKHKINIRILGPNDEARTLLDIISPEAVDEKRIDYATFKELLENIGNSKVLTDETVNDTDYWEVGLKAPITNWRYFTRSKPNYLNRQANRLLNYARGVNPDADYMVVHEFSGEVIKRYGVLWNIAWFGKRYNEGNLEIIRSVKKDTGQLIASQKEEWVLNSKDYILSDENLLEVLLSRSFERNFTQFESYISRYNELTPEEKAVVPVLGDALLKMLVLEQVSLRSRLGYMSGSRQALSQRLEYLEFLQSHRFEIKKDTPEDVAKIAMDVVLNLQVYSLGQRKWWERYLLLNGTKNAKIARYTQKAARDLMLKWFGNHFSKKEIVAKMRSALDRKKFLLNGRYHQLKKSNKKTAWSQLTLERVQVDDLLREDPRFESFISRDEFTTQMQALAARDAGVLFSSDSAQVRRDDMKAENPFFPVSSTVIPYRPGLAPVSVTEGAVNICEQYLSE